MSKFTNWPRARKGVAGIVPVPPASKPRRFGIGAKLGLILLLSGCLWLLILEGLGLI